MNREIKFRAWGHIAEEDNYRMFMNPLLFSIGSFGGRYDAYLPYIERNDPVCDHVLMQYTGLKDKNGKEIYENDLIMYDSYGRYQIVWDEHSACFDTDCIEKRGLESFMFTNLLECNDSEQLVNAEVIGNIYENPELLENAA